MRGFAPKRFGGVRLGDVMRRNGFAWSGSVMERYGTEMPWRSVAKCRIGKVQQSPVLSCSGKVPFRNVLTRKGTELIRPVKKWNCLVGSGKVTEL